MARGRRPRTIRSCARRWIAPRRNRRFADDPLKLERIDELGDDEIISVYTDGPFVDLCRGPHVPRHRPAQALQAAARRRRVLARRREAPDAAAHLRHGVLQEGGARRATSTGIEEAKKRDHRRLGKELDLFMFHPFVAGRRVLDRARARRSTTCSCDFMRERQRRRLPRDQDAAALQQGAVGDRRGTGASTARTCSSCSTTRRASTTSRSSR